MRSGLRTNVHVGPEDPGVWQPERLRQRWSHWWEADHVLQVGTEAFELKRGPDLVLKHTVGVLRPLVEHVCRRWVLLLRCLDVGFIVPERHLNRTKLASAM